MKCQISAKTSPQNESRHAVMCWHSKWPGKPAGLFYRSFRCSQACYLAAQGCTWQQREGVICPLHPLLAEKAILNVSCSKLKELSNRDDNNIRTGVSEEVSSTRSSWFCHGAGGQRRRRPLESSQPWDPHICAHKGCDDEIILLLPQASHPQFPPSDPTSSICFWQEKCIL